ncbi:uncharacterized protein LOC132704320 [Cylas formicarius]|uniref:uncharacterized protein LOC132704320 n=1 Tax=Cylas formicarius TaxID=197179 RepID=UPI0029589E46|nr:uncharacterized protein LOC132704320 [Cylas formicarius]
MLFSFVLVVSLGAVFAAPGLDFDPWLDDHAPILTAPIIKALAPAPIIKTPFWEPAPTIIKTAPIYKAITPATSYASFSQYQVEPVPIITKTLIASPPILKAYAPWKW